MSIYKGNKKIAGLYRGEDVEHATELHAGIIEIATQEEVNNGIDDLKAVTPLKLNKNTKQTRENVEELLEDVNDLRKNTPSNELIGSSLVIEDSAEMRVGKADILGVDVQQDTYEGYNFFDKEKFVVVVGSSSFEKIDTGIKAITTSTTSTGAYNACIFLIGLADDLNGKTITLSSDVESNHKWGWYLGYCSSNGGSREAVVRKRNIDVSRREHLTITVDSSQYSGKYLCVALFSSDDSAGATEGEYTFYKNLMIYEGEYDENKPYESYVGGTSSPNIEYPQKIKAVDGEYDFKFQNKNVLPYPYNYSTQKINGVDFIDNGDGTITANGTATSDANYTIRSSSNRLILQKGTYTFSARNKGGQNMTHKIQWTYRPVGSPEASTAINTFDTTKITKEFETDVEIAASIRVYKDVTVNNVTFYPQIEKGTEATPYVPHEEQNLQLNCSKYPLYSENDKYIYMNGTEGEGWYVYNEWQKYIFSGDEYFYSTSVSPQGLYYNSCVASRFLTNIDKNVEGVKVHSNYFKGINVNDRYKKWSIFKNASLLFIFTSDNNTFSEKTEFTNWLAMQYSNGNPLYIIYKLAEPTYTKITDEDFINQLNALSKLKLYKEKTHIDVTTENEDVLLPRLDVIYYKDMTSILDKLENRLLLLESEG